MSVLTLPKGTVTAEPEQTMLFALVLSRHVPGAEVPSYWHGKVVSP